MKNFGEQKIGLKHLRKNKEQFFRESAEESCRNICKLLQGICRRNLAETFVSCSRESAEESCRNICKLLQGICRRILPKHLQVAQLVSQYCNVALKYCNVKCSRKHIDIVRNIKRSVYCQYG